MIDLGEVSDRVDGRTETSMCLIGCGAGFDAQLMATTRMDSSAASGR